MTLVRWIGFIGGLLLVLGSTPAAAQSSADAFFHEAAQHYVAGDTEAAQRAVTRGLEAFPSDSRLQALKEKLEQTKKQGGGGRSSQQGQQSQQQEEQSKGGSEQQDQSGTSGEEGQSPQKASSNQDASRRSGTGDSAAGAEEADTKGREQGQTGERRRANALSRAQAARLLRALQDQEAKLLREIRGEMQEGETVEKDW